MRYHIAVESRIRIRSLLGMGKLRYRMRELELCGERIDRSVLRAFKRTAKIKNSRSV